jgi:Na+-driven multidrug efflux pump
MWIAVVLTLTLSAIIFAIVQLLPRQIVMLFIGHETGGLSPEEAARCLSESAAYLKSMSYDYLVVSVIFNIGGLAMAAGQTWFSLLSGIISSVAFRIPAAILLGIHFNLGMLGLGYAAPLASVGAMLIGLIYLASGVWKKRPKEGKHVIVLEN